MRTGIFGGTFDPIHIGHLMIAETIRTDFPLDRIVFIPAASPPHKFQIIGLPEKRFKMVQLAIRENPYFLISDIELRSSGVSYTIDTIQRLRKISKWQDDDLFLIIGADSLVEINSWREPDKILNDLKTLVVKRPGYDLNQVETKIFQKVTLVPTPMMDISSSAIRTRIRYGKSIRYWVHEEVEEYIRQEGLYR